MEQRRYSGKGHWYHETQTNYSPDDVLPLVPEAAHVDDRFLLDLALPEDILAACDNWLAPARALCEHLFPPRVKVTRLQTLSAYDRLSTALTVAQACGLQRLCNHYAALLTPLPGPDSSRESNRRLAQITQYARQLASSPNIIDGKSLQELDDVGLTHLDIVLISQIIGFVGYQARVVAIIQAVLGYPVRWLPGHAIQPHSRIEENVADWRALLPEVEPRSANAQQLASLARWQTESALRNIAPVLCHEPAILDGLGKILIHLHAVPPSVSETRQAAEALLDQSPDRFSAAQFTPLVEEGFPVHRAIQLLAFGALRGWLSRLRIALGRRE